MNQNRDVFESAMKTADVTSRTWIRLEIFASTRCDHVTVEFRPQPSDCDRVEPVLLTDGQGTHTASIAEEPWTRMTNANRRSAASLSETIPADSRTKLAQPSGNRPCPSNSAYERARGWPSALQLTLG